MAQPFFSIKADFDKLGSRLTDIDKKQLPFATSQALNSLARHAVADLRTNMQSVFDRPNPFTLRAF